MKGSFFTTLAALSFAFATSAAAQASADSEAPVPVQADTSVDVEKEIVAPTSVAVVERVSIGLTPLGAASAPPEGVKDFLFGTQQRTSRTLLIGGVAIGTLGVAVVKGHVGAVMGVAGLLGAVGGLYFAFY